MTATETLEQAAAEHDALDWSIGRATDECPVCGEDAILVSTRQLPDAGALDLDGYTIHRDDGDAYYHRDD